uniref:PRKG1_interact domain-containing protein n=1 Tax=Steinernema glaseri TaxID=37863 RepID=A0A1I8ASX6_9BILA
MNGDLISAITIARPREKTPPRPEPAAQGTVRFRPRTALAEPRGRQTAVVPDVPARLKQRKKTVAFGSTVPYSLTVDGALAKRREFSGDESSSSRNSNPVPANRQEDALKANPVSRYTGTMKEKSSEKGTLNPTIRRTEKDCGLQQKVATLQEDNEIMKKQLNALKEENLILKRENRIMKNDISDLKSRMEDVFQCLTEMVDSAPSMAMQRAQEPLQSNKPSTGIEKHSRPLSHSTPEFSVATQRVYERVLNRRQNSSSDNHYTPLLRRKGNPTESKDDSFSDLDDENHGAVGDRNRGDHRDTRNRFH